MGRTERDRLADLRDAVTELYRANRRQGHEQGTGQAYDYVCPSVGTYPYQWFWDSCFHAIVLSHLDIVRAEAELATLLINQQPDGFVPHMAFWQVERSDTGPYRLDGGSPRQSASMQPPVLAEAVAAVAARGRGASYLREVLPSVRRFYDWCEEARDPDRDGLIAILEPHESGMDQTPSYDAYLGLSGGDPAGFEAAWRGVAESNAAVGQLSEAVFERDRFVVEDVAVNVLYAENQRVLSGLLASIGDTDGAAQFGARADRTASALVERCWSSADEDFHGLAGRDETLLPAGTVAGLLPILLADLPADKVDGIAGRLADPAQFGTSYPVPSVSLRNPAYRRAPAGGTVLWRGPSWINTNWYLARGLRRHGRDELASRIEEGSLRLVARSGFREHYDAERGQGYGALGFAWSALVLDTLEARFSERGAATD